MSVIALPARRPLRYFGSKWNLAPWIISNFPTHDHFVDPFFGGGAILFRKQPVKLETVNDLNGRVVNYFQILRDRPLELINLIDLTPWAKDEYKLNQTPAQDPLEDARRFHSTCWMSIHAGPIWAGFRNQRSVAGRFAAPPDDLIRHDLWTVAQRLREVQILNMDALELLESYHGREDPFIYLDPPYVISTLSGRIRYGDFTQDDDFHRQLIKPKKLLSTLTT